MATIFGKSKNSWLRNTPSLNLLATCARMHLVSKNLIVILKTKGLENVDPENKGLTGTDTETKT